MSVPALATLHGSAVTEAAFPEGVFRLPAGGVLQRSDSAAAALGRAWKFSGRHPLQTATVFLHEGQAFALVDYPDGVPSLFFPTRHTPAELEAFRQARTFGKRTAAP